mmetsp:Transcript_24323/g.52433  ORF Transcript_24323/g.52433 Transcript_24323/m.52433 type:complete len:287 (+) Transcript_24323:214-1074(+)
MEIGDGIIGKVLGAKDLGDGDGDGNKITLIVAMLKNIVKTLVDRAVSDEDEPQRFLQNSTLNGLRESVVTKGGVNYTVLELVDGIGNPADFVGNELVFRSYNLTKLLTNNVTLEVDIAALTKAVNERLGNVSEKILDVFCRLHVGVENIHTQSQDLQSSLDSILPYYYTAVVFVCFIMVLTCILMVGVILAWKEKQPRLFRHVQDRLICPIFILSGLFMWIFTVVFLTLGVLAGDFCVNSPDVQVTKILEQSLQDVSGIAFNFAYYYQWLPFTVQAKDYVGRFQRN